ncbi:MAG: GNAT family N-acetyltransferase [Oscillospiraceae bacterium]|nr:GNAT family N-acetyltransferase [Oscillospiraceae bacterium]
MEIIKYQGEYKQQVIDLILHIQNDEAKIDLQIEEQPDLLDVEEYYFKNGGNFLIAIEDNKVIGTFAYMNYGNGNAVLKKFFVAASWRRKKSVWHSIIN